MATPEPLDPTTSLVRRALSGDQAAETELTERLLLPLLNAAVSKYLLGTAKKRYEKEDVIQEVFQHLYQDGWKKLRPYDPSKALFKTYVWSVTRNWIKDHSRGRGPPEPLEDAESGRSPDSGPEEKARMGELIQRIAKVLDEEDLLLFQWVYLEPLERKDIAERLQISLESVYKRIQRMEARVKEVLSRPEGPGPRDERASP